jgi:hypothetical protein
MDDKRDSLEVIALIVAVVATLACVGLWIAAPWYATQQPLHHQIEDTARVCCIVAVVAWCFS